MPFPPRSTSTFARPYEEEIFVRNNTEENMKVTFGEAKGAVKGAGGVAAVTGTWRAKKNALALGCMHFIAP